jgi:endonuclease/exonuclease/phosphatase family metal-dependent hydrolase
VIRSWFSDQPALLALASGAQAKRFAPARRLLLTGEDGVALCVRGGIEQACVVELPRERSTQRRVALVANLEVRGTSMTVVTTHLHNHARVARRQLDALLTRIVDEPRPRILLGDLNLRPSDVSDPLGAAGFHLVDADPTEPAWEPVQRIDHVAVDGLDAERAVVPVMAVSDHRPVVVELTPVS